jgi:hypothetical protein
MVSLSHAHKKEVWGKVAGDDTSDLIRHVADMLCQGKSKDAIRAYMVAQGATDEGQMYLTYSAAVIIAGDRVSARAKVA